MEALEEKLNYIFKDKALLKKALNHSSYANEKKSLGIESNERLEFLGDSVLGLVVATYLFKNNPKMPEGQMTKQRAELVCEGSLFSVAKELSLGDYICLGRGEEQTGGRKRESILADAVEAIIAAQFLDGGMEVARKFIHKYIIDKAKNHDGVNGDYKTALQEFVQRKPKQILSYELISESGPDHQKTFEVQVLLNNAPIGKGCGSTKKDAQQFAAKAALDAIK